MSAKTKKRVVTMGEIMMRLSAPGFKRFTQSKEFTIHYGGSEANVAVGVSSLGLQGAFVSKVPKHELGQAAVNQLKRYGVDTQSILRGGQRLGLYYLETGASMRGYNVIYDRAESSFAKAQTSEFDFDKIFEDADWFHISGITPALNPSNLELSEKALSTAKKRGIVTSLDMNYRSKLWSREEAGAALKRLCPYVDVLIGAYVGPGNPGGKTLLGIQQEEPYSETNKLRAYESVFKQLQNKYGFKYLASTLRVTESASDNQWSAIIYDGKNFLKSKEYPLRIVDRVGGGDAFVSGLIFGLCQELSTRQTIEFATAAAALKQTIPGDFNHVSANEVFQLLTEDQTFLEPINRIYS